MRRWLLVLLVLLFPLRGWIGDAMAAEMLQQHMHAAALQAAHGQHDHAGGRHHAPAGHEDCDHHAAPAAAADAAQPHATGDCPTCGICQVCSSVALSLTPVTAAEPEALSQPRPHAVPRGHPSAERLAAFKPPRG
jgi:hypothetical protein